MKSVGNWESAAEFDDEKSKKKRSGGFQSLGLDKPLLDGIIRLGYNVPTPIQRKGIPPMIQGNDVVAMARTGSGKTAAFLIPMLNLLKSHSKTVGIRGLVLSPTRELSLQILRFGIQLNKFLDLRFAAIVGGSSLEQQFELLASNPDIVIATPGRLLHIMEEASLQLSMVKSIVLDEADRLFELGLQPQIVAIMQKLPDTCQRSLFSATMPSVLAEFTAAGLHNPIVIRLDAEMKLSDKLKQSAFLVRNNEKVAALIVLLKKLVGVSASNAGNNPSEGSQALIFVESKFHVDYLQMIMDAYHISCSAVHGNMDQEARRNAVRAFSKRETSVMVVTDVAARGLDLPLLDNVINFSFPSTPKLFVHRVGRVARAGRSGTAYSLMTYEDMSYYVDLMHFLDRPLQSRREEGDLLFVADDGCYGRMVEDDLQLELDFLRRLELSDVELRNITKVVENAHKKFSRTKKKATHDGIQEARTEQFHFDQVPIHPIFLERLASNRIAAAEAKADLRRFKAKETVLEMFHGEKMFEIKKPVTLQSLWKASQEENAKDGAEEGEGMTSPQHETEGAGLEKTETKLSNKKGNKHEKSNAIAPSSLASTTAPVKKLSLAESLLLKAQERRKREREITCHDLDGEFDGITVFPSQSVRRIENVSGEAFHDKDFYMEDTRRNTADDAHYSVKDATLDIGAETAQEAEQQRQVYAWSKKKNRYVRMHVNDAKALLRGVKNESGKAVNFKSKLDTYSKWTKKSNTRIQDVGEEEDLGPLNRARAAAQETHNRDDETGGGDENEAVDISDPNQGKKLRIGRKMRRLPKDGHVRTFEEMALAKRKATKEKERLARKHQRRKGK